MARHRITGTRLSQWMRMLALGALASVSSACGDCRNRQPTFERDIKPILAKHCLECHAKGGVTPVLETYAQVRMEAFRVRREVTARTMPPWGVDNTGYCNSWQSARWLPNEDVMAILRWVDEGGPQGDPKGPDPVVQIAQTPFREDAVVDIGGRYRPDVGPGGNRCFVVDPKLDRDRLLVASKVHASKPHGISQVTLYALDSDEAERDAVEQDEHAAGLGYPCAGSIPTKETRLVSSWTYGQPATRHFEGTGVRLHAHRKLVAQVHFNVLVAGRDYETDLGIGLELDDRAKELQVVRIAGEGTLPVGKTRIDVTASHAFTSPVTVYGVVPHMHYGRVMQLQRVGATTSCVAVFDHWKVGREQVFLPTTPMQLEAGDALRMSCAYRTTGWNAPMPLGARRGADDEEECTSTVFVAPR